MGEPWSRRFGQPGGEQRAVGELRGLYAEGVGAEYQGWEHWERPEG